MGRKQGTEGDRGTGLPVGRLAPSPTGCLHLGNARSLLVAWLDAKALGGSIVLRIEDLDLPRAVPGADRQIVADLERLGLDWSNELGDEHYQSHRFDLYGAALDQLRERELLYPCFCSRREIREAVSAPHGTTPRYPGTCRDLSEQDRQERWHKKSPAWRFRVEPSEPITFTDRLHGKQVHDLAAETGDFIVARSDGLPSYHLAVVYDDIAMGITEVVRGDDLLDATPRQLRLYEAFDAAIPRYTHIPLLLDAENQRLAKRFGAIPLADYFAAGMSGPEIVGHLAASIGLIERPVPISPEDLVADYRPDRLTKKSTYLPLLP